MKNNRQAVITELIETYSIGKQEELIALLKERGFKVAQATVSRDLRQMKIVKTPDGEGKFRFVLPVKDPVELYADYAPTFASFIISAEYSMNNVVIKTHNGMANAVAIGLDSVDSDEILGCVAGDDCIIVVTRGEEQSRFVCESIESMVAKAHA